jgi:hypothetical protein
MTMNYAKMRFYTCFRPMGTYCTIRVGKGRTEIAKLMKEYEVLVLWVSLYM